MYKGLRSTTTNIILNRLNNLKIIINTTIYKVFFKGNKVIGILSLNSKSFYILKEVILLASTLNTLKIILHFSISLLD